MASNEAMVAIIVGAWAAANTISNFMNTMNERRDTVVIGFIKDAKLETEHKRLIVKHDWVPTGVGALLISLAGIAAMWFLPDLLQLPSFVLPIRVFAGVFLAWVLAQVYLSVEEYKFMKKEIDSSKKITTERRCVE